MGILFHFYEGTQIDSRFCSNLLPLQDNSCNMESPDLKYFQNVLLGTLKYMECYDYKNDSAEITSLYSIDYFARKFSLGLALDC